MASSVRMTWTTRLAKSRRAKRTARARRSRTPISVTDSSQDVMGSEEPWSVRQVPALDRPGLPVVPIARILNRLANSSRSLSVRHVLDRCRQMSYPASADRWSLGARPRLGATAEG